ncbi:hypothetical protein AVEN_266699-1 [Araneus ventricosus]|uniref:Uncharacterized protein n=1 Tax=Araneus ventricosus TaxID=182803 RepID=A0A4Y2PT83_ARAVE|nr:hypothetical protein AVEN_266699-1 [Araneus ventricosus]
MDCIEPQFAVEVRGLGKPRIITQGAELVWLGKSPQRLSSRKQLRTSSADVCSGPFVRTRHTDDENIKLTMLYLVHHGSQFS